MKRRRRGLSEVALLRAAEKLFLNEVMTFEGTRRIGLRVEGAWPDRSVFAVAFLEGCTSIAVARVHEGDLVEDPGRALQIVYMLEEDLALMRAVLTPSTASDEHQ